MKFVSSWKRRSRAAALITALIVVFAAAPAHPQSDPHSLSSLKYVWGVAADATDVCPRLPEAWQADCRRAAEGLRNVVAICSDFASPRPGCVPGSRSAAELGDALKSTVLAIDGANAACAVRNVTPGRCTELEHSRGRLAAIAARIVHRETDMSSAPRA